MGSGLRRTARRDRRARRPPPALAARRGDPGAARGDGLGADSRQRRRPRGHRQGRPLGQPGLSLGLALPLVPPVPPSPSQRDPSGPAPTPFVVGVGRSGTTLLRLMLDAHPQMTIPPETHFVPAVIEACRPAARPESAVEAMTSVRQWGDQGIDAAEMLDRMRALEPLDAAAALRSFYALQAERQGKPRWGDKTPVYVESMDLIGEALPEARFIHLIRDGRDVALSRARRGFGKNAGGR